MFSTLLSFLVFTFSCVLFVGFLSFFLGGVFLTLLARFLSFVVLLSAASARVMVGGVFLTLLTRFLSFVVVVLLSAASGRVTVSFVESSLVSGSSVHSVECLHNGSVDDAIGLLMPDYSLHLLVHKRSRKLDSSFSSQFTSPHGISFACVVVQSFLGNLMSHFHAHPLKFREHCLN